MSSAAAGVVRRLPGLLVLALLPLGACSGGSGGPDGSSPTPTPPGASVPPPPTAAGPAASPSASGAEPEACLEGRYRLQRFAVGGSGGDGSGEGGDVTVTFSDGAWTLRGGGRQPATGTLDGRAAELRVDGSIRGTATPLQGGRTTVTVGRADGTATLTTAGRSRALPMTEVADLLAPQADATVTCAGSRLTVDLPGTRLELERP